ncbi:MAG: DUF3489 domain-containing protein [Microvirga sp.]
MSKPKTRNARPLTHEDPGSRTASVRARFKEAVGEAQHPREGSKQALVVGLLSRPKGASLNDLVAATGWLPHTARAALTGVRRRGFAIERVPADDGRSLYRIATAEPDKPARKTRTGRRRGSAKAEAQAAR